MMNRFFTLLLAASCLTAVGQVTYPYNPDGNADGDIAVGDLQDFLGTYGNPFSPSEILVDGETLTTVLTQLQNSIDSLSGLTGSGGSVLDMPLGTVLPIATESVPEGWMLCDGREISIEDYQGLYDLIGTTYGAGDSAFWAQVFYPATTFNIPDLRGRTMIGANDMGGEQSDVLAIHSASVGEVGGEEMHQLAEVEMPIHTHAPEGSLVSSFVYGAVENGNGNNRVFVSELTLGDGQAPSGGDQPHNNMQPYMALNYILKAQAAEDVVATLQNTIETQQGQIDLLSELIDSVSELPPVPPSPITLECIDMGISATCGAVGLSDIAQLTPSDGFRYSLGCDLNPDENFLLNCPHWRRFQVFGITEGYVGDIFLRWQSQVYSVTPQVDNQGNFFIYFWTSFYNGSVVDCVQDGIFLEIPESNSIDIGWNPQGYFELGISNGSSLMFSSFIDFY